MTVPDLLLTFVASAIAFAGFAGVVALIDRGAAKVSAEVASFRVRYLIVATGAIIVFSISPMLAILLGGGRDVWPVSCGIEAAFTLFIVLRAVRERFSFQGEQAAGMRPAVAAVLITLGFAAIGLLIAGAAGYAPASASYATGVFWYLLCAGSIFAQLVFALNVSLHSTQGRIE